MTKTMLNKEMLESMVMECSTYHLNNTYCVTRANTNGVKFSYVISLYDTGFISIYRFNHSTDTSKTLYGMSNEVA